MLKYCGLALLTLTAVLLLRGQKSEFSGLVGLAATVALLGSAVSELFPILSFLSQSVMGTEFDGYLTTLTKALGITLSVQFTAELCRDAGEGALASKLELVGKVQILALCVPLIEELTSLAGAMLQ